MKQNKKLLVLSLIVLVVWTMVGYFPKQARAATLVAQWDFNGTINDSISGYSGTANGSPAYSNALNLSSSTSDYVSVPDTDNFFDFYSGGNQPFTIGVWAKVSSGNSIKILSKGTISGGNLSYQFTYNSSSGQIAASLYDASGGSSALYGAANVVDVVPGQEYIDDTWQFLTISWDGTGNTSGLKFYGNGSLLTANVSNNFSFTNIRTNSDDLFIGRVGDSYSDGSLDNLMVYSGVLTDSEISALYAGQADNYHNSRVNAQVLNADGNNLTEVDTLIDSLVLNMLPANQIQDTDGIEIEFATDFQDVANVTNVNTTITQNYDIQDIVAGTYSLSGQKVQIPVATQGDRPGEELTITFDNVITTPLNPGTYIITVSIYDLGSDGVFGGVAAAADTLLSSGSTGVVFGVFSVDISASVDPTLTLSLESFYDASGNVAASHTCNLSTSSKILINTEINLCLYGVIVSTNGAGGYTAYVRDTGNFSTGIDEMIDAGATMSPNPAEAEYGIATTASGQTINQINDLDGGGVSIGECAYLWTHGTETGVNSSAVTEADQDFASATGAVADDITVLCHMAAIAGDTPNGTYTTTTIITAVGNF